jgi:hypothetical protein
MQIEATELGIELPPRLCLGRYVNKWESLLALPRG